MSLVWLGGMGLIVLAVAVLPLLGVGGRQIFKAEAPGPMKESKLTPRMASTAKGLWLIYGLFSLICALAFRWAGMSWDDAVVHMFTTMGLGGFSTHDASFAYWNSPTIEMVTMVFMTLAGINFATHFVAIRGGGLGAYKQDPEVRWYLYVMFGSVAAIALYLLDTGTYSDPWRRSATPPSTPSRSPPPPASPTPTTPSGRSSRRCGCCSCAASSPAPDRPAAASR